MSYDSFYSDLLWKIYIVTDESDAAEEYARVIESQLETLKNPPDVETYSLYGKPLSGQCRKVLFILDELNRTREDNKVLLKWLNLLGIYPDKSLKYMVLRVTTSGDQGFMEPLGGLQESQVVKVSQEDNVCTWWPRVIRFLCKTRNWNNSAYILLHSGFGDDVTDVRKMTENIKEIEEHKKTLEVMLGPFGPRNLHNAKWSDSIATNGSSVRDVHQDTKNMDVTSVDHTLAKDTSLTTETLQNGIIGEKKQPIDKTVAKYVFGDPLKPAWKDHKSFASVVPVFILLKPDITVAEKCCLTDYAREFPKTHFLCISELPPSEYMKLLSSNVYGRTEVMEFVFSLLKKLKVISSIKNKSKDSCVCNLL